MDSGPRRHVYNNLKLPSSWVPKTISTYEDFLPVALKNLERLDKQPDGTRIILGLDIEWDSLTPTESSEQHPATLQLAMADGEIIVVLQILLLYASIEAPDLESKTALAQILTHGNVILTVVGIKNDTKNLVNHYDERVLGSSEVLRARLFDSNLEGRKAHFIGGVYGFGALTCLLQLFFLSRSARYFGVLTFQRND
jgi:hypothetical protein